MVSSRESRPQSWEKVTFKAQAHRRGKDGFLYPAGSIDVTTFRRVSPNGTHKAAETGVAKTQAPALHRSPNRR